VAEADGLLPLAVVRHMATGSLSLSEFTRWRTIIGQIIAAANSAEEEGRQTNVKEDARQDVKIP
jgi:hypothetical protein